MCADFRKLNEKTISLAGPTPRLGDIIDTMSQTRPNFISNLDLFSGYWQCEVHENLRHKTAFVTGDRYLQFRRFPFALKIFASFLCPIDKQNTQGLSWNILFYIILMT